MVLADIRSSRAFTLVELAIVIVIIGLLTGGIIGGKSLIHASELRTVTSDYSKFIAAVNDFRSQYGAKPGDLTKATNYWGLRAGSGSDATCYNAINSNTGTCNGNGDGFLTDNGASSATRPELFLFWQHLAYAGFIQGTYTGSTITAGSVVRAEVNSPASRLADAMLWYSTYGLGTASGHVNYFDGQYDTEELWIAHATSSRTLTAREAWDIDTKIDDGNPATGAVFSLKGLTSLAPACATTSAVSTAAYNLTRSDKTCELHMQLPR